MAALALRTPRALREIGLISHRARGARIDIPVAVPFDQVTDLPSCYTVVVEIIRVKILEPKAKRILHDLEELNLIEIDRKENGPKVQRRFGAMKGFVTHMADDFDAPLEDLKDYM